MSNLNDVKRRLIEATQADKLKWEEASDNSEKEGYPIIYLCIKENLILCVRYYKLFLESQTHKLTIDDPGFVEDLISAIKFYLGRKQEIDNASDIDYFADYILNL